MLEAATRLGRVLLGPARHLQAVEQALCLLGVELLSKRLTANILARDLVLAVDLDPSQGAACFPVAIARSDLPQGRARMWPKEIQPKPDGSGHELLVDGLGFQGAADSIEAIRWRCSQRHRRPDMPTCRQGAAPRSRL